MSSRGATPAVVLRFVEPGKAVCRTATVISEEQMQHDRPWRGEDVHSWFACEKLDERTWSLARQTDLVALRSHHHDARVGSLPRIHLDRSFSSGAE
jgi:hypothetical protein